MPWAEPRDALLPKVSASGSTRACGNRWPISPPRLTGVPAEREGFVRWQTPFGEFWAPVGTDMRFLLAEQSLDVYGTAELGVQPGDLVLDCGANVGTFTRKALTAGAERVIAIEPSPRNVYCLR